MSNTAFIDDWNSIIPFKIKAKDLEKPTEQFVYKAILHFFKLMHYDVSSYENMYSESTEALTLKRVELVARINYIYQLCSDSKQTSFFYVDLVKPTAKKIIHLLKILLNYLFYINMVKETVLDKANSCTEKYFELNAKLNQEQITKEEKKIQANNINRHIDDLKNLLPQLKNKIETLQQRKHIVQEKLSALKVHDQELADKIIKLKLDHSEYADHLVGDEEATVLMETKCGLENEIEMLVENAKQLKKNYEIQVASINEIKPCIALLEKMLQLGFDESCKNIRSELADLKKVCEKFKTQLGSLMSTSDTLHKNCIEIETLVEEKQQELEIRKKVLQKSVRKNDSKYEDKEKHLKALQDTNELMEQILADQRAEMQIIIDMTDESLKIISSNLIE
uniref:Kinetochore protein Nuf2 N-terminal domain-containing protein n=1 Tax=Anopheles dirus TaxID=7168 RepID=A0A182NNC0_9DIPT